MTFDVDDLEEDIKPCVERTYKEFPIQCAIIDHVTGRRRVGKEFIRTSPAFPGVFVTHFYQGRSAKEGFLLKLMGVVPGVPDLLFIWPEEARGFDIGFIEVKTPIGQLSSPQRRFKGFCYRYRIKWAIGRSVNDVHQQLIKWGLNPAHNAIREPDTRTTAQKYQAIHDMYKP